MEKKYGKFIEVFLAVVIMLFAGCKYIPDYFKSGDEITIPENQAENGSSENQNVVVENQETQETESVEENPESASQSKKLTLIVYMAADNDLERYAISNLKQMEHSNINIENGNLNVLVLLDRSEGYDETNGNWTDTRLFELKHDRTSGNFIVSKRIDCPLLGLMAESNTELDMGDFNVLKNLVTFAKENYESEKYGLIIWGHGTGWRYSEKINDLQKAVAIDDKSDSYMTVVEEEQALRNQGLNVIGFDTCFGGVFENVYELKYCARYTVGSSDITPATGWNYKKLLEELEQSDFSDMEIAHIMAECSSVKMTIFDNVKMSYLMNAIEDFSKNIANSITTASDRNNVLNQILTSKQYSYTQYPCDLYLDLYSLADLYINSSDEKIAQSSANLKQVVSNAASTVESQYPQIGIHFIPKTSEHTFAVQHSSNYLKSENNHTQCSFIKESIWWVPTKNGNSGSLLDKLFYTNF